MAAALHATALLTSCFLAWRVSRLPASAARAWFLAFVLSVTWWAACATLAALVESAAWFGSWSRLAYVGTAAVPFAWLGFVDAFTRARRPRLRLAMWAVVPALTVIVAFVDGRLGWLVADVETWARGAGSAFESVRGPWYWYVHLPYSYALIALGVVRAYAFARTASTVVRRRVGLLLIAISIPIAANVLDRTGAVTTRTLDLTVVGFTVAALLIAGALAAGRFLEVPPGAYRTAFEHVDTSVLVVDTRLRVIDANRAAMARFGLRADAGPVPLGRILPSVAAAMRRLPPEGGDIDVRAPTLPGRHAGVEVRAVPGERGEPLGHVLVIHDREPASGGAASGGAAAGGEATGADQDGPPNARTASRNASP
jgi:PAS domain-containing protein